MIEHKSVSDNIIEMLGASKETIEDIAHKSSIYILYAIDIHKVTEDDLRIGSASYLARFPNRTYDDYLRYKSNWDADKYSFNIEPQGYFLDRETAEKYAEDNVGDINEAGCYPYVLVSSMPLNRVYPRCNIREHQLFRYNKNTGRYEKIAWDYNEGTQYLQKRATRGI